MKLQLDLAHPRQPASPLGWLLLVIGLLAAGWTGWRFQTLSDELPAARDRLAALSPALSTNSPARARPRTADLPTDAPLTAQTLLGTDWGGLLNTLEKTRPAGVALLSLEAEASRGGLVLGAEARDHRAMLAYADKLESAPGVDRMALANHADQERDGEKAVRFALRGHWGAR